MRRRRRFRSFRARCAARRRTCSARKWAACSRPGRRPSRAASRRSCAPSPKCAPRTCSTASCSISRASSRRPRRRASSASGNSASRCSRSRRTETLATRDLGEAIEALLARLGKRIACGTPLGLGKPVPLLNALYARAKADAQLRLSIFTALSLEVPRAASDLERRFLEPFARRLFDGVPDLDYLADLRAGRLPANVELSEFYFRPGAMLGVPLAQQSYIASNYTHAGRDMLARGMNAVLVMVSERGGRYSLSSNPDLTLDVVEALRAGGGPCAVAGMVNRSLPFMGGEAEVGADYFDVLVDAPAFEHRLFGVPNSAADPPDHAIGLHAAALVRDGGTLQLGIGSLGDSVAHWLSVRHAQPGRFAAAATALGLERYRALIEREGGLGGFAEGLYGSSEMFTWGLMWLYRAGLLRREDENG